MTLSVDPVEVKFLADMSQLKRDMEEMKRLVADGARQGTERAAAATAAGVNSMLSGLTTRLAGIASLAGLQQTLTAIHTATLEAEKSQLMLSGALKATGHAAGLTKGEIEELVDQLTASTTFDDESIRSAAAALLRFRDIQGDTFREALKLAPDLAAALGTDLVDATRQLGKAILSPESGMRSLKAAGVSLSEPMAEVAQKMRDTGDAAGSARIVLDQLRKSVGGTAEEGNQGLVGGTAALKKAWNEMLEAFGNTDSYQASTGFLIDGLTKKINLLKQAVGGGSGSITNMLAELVGIRAPGEQARREQEERSRGAAKEEAERAAAAAGAARRDEERQEEARALAAKKAAELAKKQTEEYNALIKSLKEKVAVSAMALEQDDALTEGQKEALRIMVGIRDGTLKLTEARKIAVVAELEALIANEKVAEQRKQQVKLEKEYAAAVEALVKPLEDQARRLEQEVEFYGQTESQIQRTLLLRLEEARAIAAYNDAAPEHLAYLDREIEARKRIAQSASRKEILDLNKKAAEDAQKEWERTAEGIERSLTDALMRGFEGGKTMGENLRDVLKNMFKTLVLQPLLKPIVEPWAQAMTGIARQIEGEMSRLFMGGWSPEQFAAQAAAEAAIPLEAFGGYHAGGIAGREPTFVRNLPAATFAGAPRLHGGGIAGDEMPAILRRGEGVFTEGQMRALGGAEVTVNITNQSQARITARERNIDGRREVMVLVQDSVSALANAGALDGVMRNNFGAARPGVLRG